MRGRARLSVLAYASATLLACNRGALPPVPTGSALPPETPQEVAPVEVPLPVPTFVADDPEPAYPYLDDEPTDKSRSVGDTSHGRVVHAAEVIESESLAILAKQKERNLRYGSSEMVGLLAFAAKGLFEATHTKLWLGNVGKKGGGDIVYSVSHNAGRDADVAFSYLDAAGKPIDAPDLVPLDKDGKSKDGSVRLDAGRTWITVRGLATAPDVEVEYVFISEPLKKKVLAWARDHKEPPEVIQRAADIMRQPGGSAPHDDHLHVRIYCSSLDIASGCVDTGQISPTKKNFSAARDERVSHAVQQLASKDPVRRANAVMRLGVMRATEAMEKVVGALNDDALEVRYAAASVIGALGGPPEAAPLAVRFPIEPEPRVRRRILEAAVAIGGNEAGDLLRQSINAARTATGVEVPEIASLKLDLLDGGPFRADGGTDDAFLRTFAVRIAGRSGRMESVPALIALLDSSDHWLRTTAVDSLALLTNLSIGERWLDDAATEDHQKGRLAFEEVYRKLSESPRDSWLAEGFRRAGYKVKAFDRTGVWELVRASASEGFIGRNARSILARIANEAEVPWALPASEACTYYLDYFTARKKRFRLEGAPANVRAACPAGKKT
ncbi:MAG: HEAT repeat domain-containing protein [Polyangiaceae bacterium]